MRDGPLEDPIAEAKRVAAAAAAGPRRQGKRRRRDRSDKLRHTLDELEVDRDLVRTRLDEIWAAVEKQPKPLRWKLRAQVGDRMAWYQLPEEVRSPHQAV